MTRDPRWMEGDPFALGEDEELETPPETYDTLEEMYDFD